MTLPYRPFHELADTPNVIVDGAPNPATVLTLSHWPGIPTPEPVRADLSAEMVFRYLDRGAGDHEGAEAVSNNHFDQDGLAGVFALVAPDEAFRQRDLLVDLAAAGDFATFRHRDAARMSMVVAAYADPERSPLGREAMSGPYPQRCALLYHELLGRLPTLQAELGRLRPLWNDEDAHLTASEQAIERGVVTIDERRDLDLAVVHVATGHRGPAHRFAHESLHDGPHPMAVHRATDCFRVVQIRGRRYELTYRYESWVQLQRRRPLPRIDLSGLASRLTEQESAGARWAFDGVEALVPRLHLVDDDESSLDSRHFTGEVIAHLQSGKPAWDPYRAARQF